MKITSRGQPGLNKNYVATDTVGMHMKTHIVRNVCPNQLQQNSANPDSISHVELIRAKWIYGLPNDTYFIITKERNHSCA